MSKVLVERSRRGGNNNRKGRSVRDIDSLPRKESMKRKYNDRKSLNENLNPLKRYLESQVGRPWDKVFSEISENLNSNSAVQKHVKDHIWDYVYKNVIVEGKKILIQRRYSGIFSEPWGDDLYVDPNSGLLKKYKPKKEKYARYDEFKGLLEKLSDRKSELLIEGDDTYKLYKDPKIEDRVIKQVARKQHAEQDFRYAKWNNQYQMQTFFSKYSNRINKKDPYWKRYIELFEESLQAPKVKVKPDLAPGVKVEYSTDSGKTFQDGVINRLEYFGNNKNLPYYWITTVSGKNEMFNPHIFNKSAYVIRKK